MSIGDPGRKGHELIERLSIFPALEVHWKHPLHFAEDPVCVLYAEEDGWLK